MSKVSIVGIAGWEGDGVEPQVSHAVMTGGSGVDAVPYPVVG